MRGPRRSWAFSLAVLWLGGCQTAQIAKNVAFVSLSSDMSQRHGEPLKEESCAVRVLGFGPMSSLKEALEKVNAKYIKSMEIDFEFKSYFFWSRNCWYVRGEGFK